MAVLVNLCFAGTTSNAILNANHITFILLMFFYFLFFY